MPRPRSYLPPDQRVALWQDLALVAALPTVAVVGTVRRLVVLQPASSGRLEEMRAQADSEGPGWQLGFDVAWVADLGPRMAEGRRVSG